MSKILIASPSAQHKERTRRHLKLDIAVHHIASISLDSSTGTEAHAAWRLFSGCRRPGNPCPWTPEPVTRLLESTVVPSWSL